ncbi:MAG: RES family NAD+ phosphorylase [Eubacteriales bacterium]|nr:RES family NAD+ phosphorylase [Eubacteriales bacterium]
MDTNDIATEIMLGFNTLRDAKQRIVYLNRFFMDQTKKEFVELLKRTFTNSEMIIRKGTSFFRARSIGTYNNGILHESNEVLAHMMASWKKGKRFKGFTAKDSFVKPDGFKPSTGRTTLSYMKCLYVAESAHTAIAEIRAVIGEFISVAKIANDYDLKVVDLSKTAGINYMAENLFDETFRNLLGVEFCSPIRDNDEYVFLQYISELAKLLGYDAIRFSSSVDTEGYNLSIFNYSKCRAVNSKILIPSKIKYDFYEYLPDVTQTEDDNIKMIGEKMHESITYFMKNAKLP